MPVALAVEPVPVGLPGRGGDGAGTGEFDERGLGAYSLGSVADGDQHLGSSVGSDTEGGDQIGRVGLGELAQQGVVLRDLIAEVIPAAGQRAQSNAQDLWIGLGGDASRNA